MAETTNRKGGKRVGRPPINITPAQVQAAAACVLNQKQLAAILGCHVNTISNRLAEPEYREAYERGKALAEVETFEWLRASAKNGNVKAQIFLAQALLGLSSRETTRQEGEVSVKYVVELPAEVPMEEWQQRFRPRAPGEPDVGGESA